MQKVKPDSRRVARKVTNQQRRPIRNRPHMKLAQADSQTLKLEFDRKGNDIDPAKEKHMHAVSFTFTDNNHIVQKWIIFDKEKSAGDVDFKLTRVR